MKPLEIKFDLLTLLEDMSNLPARELGVDRVMILAEKDTPEADTTSLATLISTGDPLDLSGMIYRAMQKDMKIALAVSIASDVFKKKMTMKP